MANRICNIRPLSAVPRTGERAAGAKMRGRTRRAYTRLGVRGGEYYRAGDEVGAGSFEMD